MRKVVTKKLLVSLVFAMVLSLTSTNVFAAVTTATVTGGSLSIGDFTVDNFANVTLDGTTKTITFTITDMAIVDARGTGAGWSVNLTATTFINATAALSGIDLNTLQASSLVLGAVSIAAGDGSTPVTNIVKATGAIDATGGVKILSAGINEGMGTYTVNIAPMTLTLLPKAAKAGTYTSTIAITITTGP